MSDYDDTSILVEAHIITRGERNDDYGHPADDMARLAEFWNCWLWNRGLMSRDKSLSVWDPPVMMGYLKDCRLIETPHKRDTWVDKAGYADVGYRAMIGKGSDEQQG